MITTTTIDLVIDKVLATLQSVTPPMHADKRFTTWVEDHDIRDMAMGSVATAFRRVQAEAWGVAEDGGIVGADVSDFFQDVEILVAYPAKLRSLYGARGRRDILATIAADAHAIRDALYDSANHLPAAPLMPRLEPLDQSNDHVWFQPIIARCHWFQAAQIVTSS